MKEIIKIAQMESLIKWARSFTHDPRDLTLISEPTFYPLSPLGLFLFNHN